MKKYIVAILIVVALVFSTYALEAIGVIDLSLLRGNVSSSPSESDISSTQVKPQTNLADITVQLNYQNPQTGEYELMQTLYFSVSPNESYTYQPQTAEYYFLDQEKSLLTVETPTDESVLTVYYTCEVCSVTFDGGDGAVLVSGSAVYEIRKGQIPTAPEYYKQGYEFVGYNERIGAVYQDTVFIAEWQEKVYCLNLIVVSGAQISESEYKQNEQNPNQYERTYTFFTTTFSLPIATYEGYSFIGWSTDKNGESGLYESVEKGTDYDLTLYSIFDVKTYSISFISPEDYYFQPIISTAGRSVYPPKVAPENAIAGYGLNWYEDQEFTTLYTFTTMPKHDVTLYGKWEVERGEGFFAFDFDDGKVESEEEFIAYLDYVGFNYLTESNKKTVTVTFATEDDYFTKEKIADYMQLMQYPLSSGISYTYSSATAGGTVFSAYIKGDKKEKEAKQSFESTGTTCYKVLDYAYTGRGDNEYFYSDNLPKSVEVETTNQLFYAVEHGYKPICKGGSSAETAYNKAKEILNAIIEPSFSDYQKALAIFDYLVMNVEYDQNAYQSQVAEWGNYDAWFLEGVFNNKKAVCDGISKAYGLLCNMEGIPCVQVSGNAHAWCKVKINNRWSIVDPTHGNIFLPNENKSVVAHEHFLMSQSQKRKLGYDSVNYQNIKADYSVNYFALKNFTYSSQTYSLTASKTTEILAIINYYKKFGSLSGCVIEFLYTGQESKFENELRTALYLAGLANAPTYLPLKSYEHGYVAKVLF